MRTMYKILIIDDDPLWLFNLKDSLASYGTITTAASLEEGLKLLSEETFDIGFFDLDLEERLGGLKLVSKAKSLGLYSVILSSNDTNEIIKQGYLMGCMDYLVKPISKKATELVFQKFSLLSEGERIEDIIQQKFITKDIQTLDTLEIIKKINLSDKSILLTGESGTGKTCLARIIHEVTCSKTQPFVSLNCSQFNETTIDSELFGHVKGAFTGALKDKKGLIEKSKDGTLFLDEVHSLSSRAQQKLLKALDEGIIYPVGSEKPIYVKFRIICATCEQIDELIGKGLFRRDLYYRIKTFELFLKPLRERRDDILPLINFYLNKKERRIVLSDEAEEVLLKYSWPANTREIEDLVENWHVQGVGIVTLNDLPKSILDDEVEVDGDNFFTPDQFKLIEELGLREFTDLMKEKAILYAMDNKNGKQVEAAKQLGISKSSMSKALDKLRGSQNELRYS